MENWKQLETIDLPVEMKVSAQELYISDSIDDFSVRLEFPKTKDILVVDFGGNVLSYHVTDEGKRLRTYKYLSENYGTDFYAKWSLFEVENSSYKSWFNEESEEYAEGEIFHYCFFSEELLDVLSKSVPKIYIERNK